MVDVTISDIPASSASRLFGFGAKTVARTSLRFAGPIANSVWDLPEFYQGYTEGSYAKMFHATGSFLGGWGGGLAAGAAYGAIFGVETGPGIIITTGVGMLVGGLLGEKIMGKIGESIDDANLRAKNQALFDAVEHNLPSTSTDPSISDLITARQTVTQAQDELASLQKLGTASAADLTAAESKLQQATNAYRQQIFDLASLGKTDPNATTGPNSLSGGDILRNLVQNGSASDKAGLNNYLDEIYKKLPLDAANRFPTPTQFTNDDQWAFLRNDHSMNQFMDILRNGTNYNIPVQNAAYADLIEYAPSYLVDVFKTPDGLKKFNETVRNNFLDDLVQKGPNEHRLVASLSGTMPTLDQLKQIPGLKDNPELLKLAEMRDKQRTAIDVQVAGIKKKYWTTPDGQVADVYGYQEALRALNDQKTRFDTDFRTATAKLSNTDLEALHTLGRMIPDILAKLPQTADELNNKPGWEFLKTDPVIAKTVGLLQAGKRDEAFTYFARNANDDYLGAVQNPKKLVDLNAQVKSTYIDLLTNQLLAGNEHLDQIQLPDKFKSLVDMARGINTENAQSADMMLHPSFMSDGSGEALAYLATSHFSSENFKAALAKLSNADIIELADALKKGTTAAPQPQQHAELAPPPVGNRNRSPINLALMTDTPTPDQAAADKAKPKPSPHPTTLTA